MLVEWLLDMVQTVLLWAAGPLPEHQLGYLDGFAMTLSNLGALNYFLPIQETVAVVVGVLVLFPVFMGVNFALWCVALLRGGSSRG